MRKRNLFLSVLFICFLFGITDVAKAGSSSGSYVWRRAREDSGIDMWTAKYSYFDGWKSRGMTFSNNQDNKCVLQVEISTLSGEIDLTITDEDGQEVCVYDNLDTSQFQITLEDEGSYEIKINARGHQGSFLIQGS